MLSRLLRSGRDEEQGRKKIVLFASLGACAATGFSILLLHSIYLGLSYRTSNLSVGFWAVFFHSLGSTFMIGLSSLSLGALLGFLFGVPRYRTEHSNGSPQTANNGDGVAKSEPRYIPNTNLEQISDWLTKLFVGATLVQLTKIPDLMSRFGRYFSATSGDQPIAVSTAIYFGILGFFIAFFYAGLYLTETLNAPSSFESALQRRAPLAETSTLETLGGSSGDQLVQKRIALADAVPNVTANQDVSARDVDFAVAELMNLAERYESIRREMPPGDERTIRMEGVVAQMRVAVPAALSRGLQFQTSAIAGERLVFTVMLQLRPDASFFNWLVDRFRIERPFVQYQAALALRSAGRNLRAQKQQVRECVGTALEILGPDTSETSDRKRVLNQILSDNGDAVTKPN